MIIARGAAPLGPLLAGILLGAASSRLTVAVLLAFTAVVAVATTLARPLRHPPPLVRAA
jgi:hypothetical protein